VLLNNKFEAVYTAGVQRYIAHGSVHAHGALPVSLICCRNPTYKTFSLHVSNIFLYTGETYTCRLPRFHGISS